MPYIWAINCLPTLLHVIKVRLYIFWFCRLKLSKLRCGNSFWFLVRYNRNLNQPSSKCTELSEITCRATDGIKESSLSNFINFFQTRFYIIKHKTAKSRITFIMCCHKKLSTLPQYFFLQNSVPAIWTRARFRHVHFTERNVFDKTNGLIKASKGPQSEAGHKMSLNITRYPWL